MNDIHRKKASEMFGVSEAEVTKEQRNTAKKANFHEVYGSRFCSTMPNMQEVPKGPSHVRFVDPVINKTTGEILLLFKCEDEKCNWYNADVYKILDKTTATHYAAMEMNEVFILKDCRRPYEYEMDRVKQAVDFYTRLMKDETGVVVIHYAGCCLDKIGLKEGKPDE